MSIIAGDIARVLEQIAPSKMAEKWDNCGWQVGDPEAAVKKAMLALDVTREVVSEAEATGVQMIISHHPLFLKGVKTIRRDSQAGGLAYRLINAGIGVYSVHTSLDSAPGGVNDILARALELKEIEVLHPVEFDRLLKLVVFVPAEYAGKVREALGGSGAGWIGKYSHCTFNTIGTGTFLPMEGSNPFIGTEGRLEQVEEVRIETVIRKSDLGQVLKAMFEAHPYEEVAYDLYPLENAVYAQGLGRVGLLPEALTLKALAQKVKSVLNTGTVRIGGSGSEPIQKIAVCGGSGADLWPLARQKGARVLVTGDVRYHAARDMLEAGMSFIDAGHFATEKLALSALKKNLAQALEKAGLEVEIIVAASEAEPWEHV
ncbi:Nif3-like dinuclear metal center hexameric protein [Desulfotruncus alcoholivorax]|uniref:Nif3-like dinuclear metal center hexameric protein n=1 Tax=Desulfotruncus alcoholivorax TaxID=265477 RepID=UPI000402A15A|nr:Nif3-like dinuclear metal center hexameric protein [Desulfotruncus alcoholivorax]